MRFAGAPGCGGGQYAADVNQPATHRKCESCGTVFHLERDGIRLVKAERMTATRVLEDQREFIARARRAENNRRAIEPLLRAKASAIAMMMPTITIFHDGRITVEYSARDQAIMAEYDRVIEQMIEALDAWG